MNQQTKPRNTATALKAANDSQSIFHHRILNHSMLDQENATAADTSPPPARSTPSTTTILPPAPKNMDQQNATVAEIPPTPAPALARSTPPTSATTTTPPPVPAPKNMETATCEGYWDHYGNTKDRYDEEIASSIDEDVSKTIKTYLNVEATALIERHKQWQDTIRIVDYGCGPGKWLQKINSAFQAYPNNARIMGMDVSQNLVNLAKQALPKAHVGRANLELLAEVQHVIGDQPVHFGVCANVLIAAETKARRNILNTISQTMAKGGVVVFVVPSLESALYCEFRWLRDGPPIADTGGDEIPTNNGQDAVNILEGTLERDGVRTKHYLREEFEAVLSRYNFRMKTCGKASYNWTMEFGEDNEDIPLHLRNSTLQGPWDWCVVAEKV